MLLPFVFFYLSLSLEFFIGWFIGRRMMDIKDTDTYRLGYNAGHTQGRDAGYDDGYDEGREDGAAAGEALGRELQEAETLREVGAIEVPYTTGVEN